MAPASVEDLMSVARDSEPDADWIVMHHPKTHGVTVVTRESFEQRGGHKSKGWVEGDLPADAGDTDAPSKASHSAKPQPTKEA